MLVVETLKSIWKKLCNLGCQAGYDAVRRHARCWEERQDGGLSGAFVPSTLAKAVPSVDGDKDGRGLSATRDYSSVALRGSFYQDRQRGFGLAQLYRSHIALLNQCSHGILQHRFRQSVRWSASSGH